MRKMRVAAALLIGSGLVATALLAQSTSRPRVDQTVIQLADGTMMTYGLAVPRDLKRDDPRPLVLALHPGGRAPYYGSRFMIQTVEPALRGWRAIIVAPDVPAQRWSNETSEQARSGPRIVDSVLSEISTGFQAAVFTATCSKYTASGVRRSSAVCRRRVL